VDARAISGGQRLGCGEDGGDGRAGVGVEPVDASQDRGEEMLVIATVLMVASRNSIVVCGNWTSKVRSADLWGTVALKLFSSCASPPPLTPPRRKPAGRPSFYRRNV
jgi:hypothetical protein